MTGGSSAPSRTDGPDPEISLLSLANLLMRRRWIVFWLGLGGAVAGLATGLLSPRVYASTAVFIPQGPDASASGLALAASQLGVRIPTTGTGAGWGPPVYVDLLASRALLEPIAIDTLPVPEDGGRRMAVADLLKVAAPSPELRVARTIDALRKIVIATEDRSLGAVRVVVTTRWPTVSFVLADRLVRAVNAFNVNTRRSQAQAERQFVEGQAADAEVALSAAEDELKHFLQQNRSIAQSPELLFEEDRLQRAVTLRQQMYTTLVENQEDARIREVRDTPVITLIESPRVAVIGEPRRTALKAVMGGLGGVTLGVLLAFLLHGLAAAKQSSTDDAREFFGLLRDATPRFLLKGKG